MFLKIKNVLCVTQIRISYIKMGGYSYYEEDCKLVHTSCL